MDHVGHASRPGSARVESPDSGKKTSHNPGPSSELLNPGPPVVGPVAHDFASILRHIFRHAVPTAALIVALCLQVLLFLCDLVSQMMRIPFSLAETLQVALVNRVGAAASAGKCRTCGGKAALKGEINSILLDLLLTVFGAIGQFEHLLLRIDCHLKSQAASWTTVEWTVNELDAHTSGRIPTKDANSLVFRGRQCVESKPAEEFQSPRTRVSVKLPQSSYTTSHNDRHCACYALRYSRCASAIVIRTSQTSAAA